ncbi:hypothetical protein U9K52_08735 [Chryseobacterium sp. MHB01]|uniref:hypothetical protein n=1 Tax=Chryseobacterium sp. MHB01 TaxID=3109433 RepID=UPI002B0035DA|nr:hypothetical protein [Chryseobacterium sp. MHB01]MEA1848993.1 hypothetical protein [Chryseobacterium sp. MHB01]
MMRTAKLQKVARKQVARRESFLRSFYQPGKKFWELGKERYLKNEKALELLVELQNRYPDEKDFPKVKIELTKDNITAFGKYSLD